MGRKKFLQRVSLGVAATAMLLLLLQTSVTQAGSGPYSAPRFRRSYSAQTPTRQNYSARSPLSRRYSHAPNESDRRISSRPRGRDYSPYRFSYSYPSRYGYGLLGYGSLTYFPRYYGYFPYHSYRRPWYSGYMGYGYFFPGYFSYGYPLGCLW